MAEQKKSQVSENGVMDSEKCRGKKNRGATLFLHGVIHSFRAPHLTPRYS